MVTTVEGEKNIRQGCSWNCNKMNLGTTLKHHTHTYTHLHLQVDVRLNATEPRGVINFGLFLGAHSVQPREPEININVEESYYICESLHAGLVACGFCK